MRTRDAGRAMTWLLGAFFGFAMVVCGLLAGVGNSAGNAAQGAQEEPVYYPGKWQFVADLLSTANRANQLAMIWVTAAIAIGLALYLHVRYGGRGRAVYVMSAVGAGVVLAGAGFLLGARLDTQLYPYL